MPKFNIIGTVHLADGFDYTIEAENRLKARAIAMQRAKDIGQYESIELQEVCINEVNLIKEWTNERSQDDCD